MVKMGSIQDPGRPSVAVAEGMDIVKIEVSRKAADQNIRFPPVTFDRLSLAQKINRRKSSPKENERLYHYYSPAEYPNVLPNL